jgi:FlaA1/EpsC-like NDP-sugar epimerase
MSIMRYLVTGSCGTIGAGLVRHLLSVHPDCEVVGLDNNESGLFFQEQQHVPSDRVRFHLADIRDLPRLTDLMRGVGMVFHAAALKHVAMCERAPMDAVQTNILGVNHVIAAATHAKVETVVFTSSDKAVNPTNVMGTSKLMGERLMSAANSGVARGGTVFASTRFGNVLGSNGSVVPIFRRQIEKGGPVTITHPEMTRFVMSVDQAVKLVVESAVMACGGEVFITKMPSIRIRDLAEVMIEELAPRYGHEKDRIEIVEIGCKPGEKFYEELMTDEETRRALELGNYFVVVPAFRGLYEGIEYRHQGVVSAHVDRPYISRDEPCLSKQELADLLRSYRILDVAE